MMTKPLHLQVVAAAGDTQPTAVGDLADMRLDQVFAALSDPIRRRVLQLLDGQGLLVSEIAAQFDISLQGVSRHIQVLVRAGLVQQERSGRISRCTLDAEPLMQAAVWLNRYSKYWQGQFDLLAATLAEIDERRAGAAPSPGYSRAVAAPRPPTQEHSRAAEAPQAPTRKRARAPRRK